MYDGRCTFKMNKSILLVIAFIGCALSVQACEDKNRWCSIWAKANECCNNPKYMLGNCAKSCGQCGSLPDLSCGCKNKIGDTQCNTRAREGQCCSNEAFMLKNCRKACAQCDEPKSVPGCPCMNHNSNCEGWAQSGLCKTANVKKTCPRACGLCKNNLKTFTVCEWKTGTIQCPAGTTIQVEKAFYGRKDLTTCPSPGYMRTTSCEARGSDAKIKAMCNGKTKCSIQALYSKFGGDPCAMTVKYAQVNYRCKPGLPASNNCQGFDLGDDEIDKAVANSGACQAVEVMKTIQDAALCNAAGTQPFGGAKTLYQKGIKIDLICDLISESLGLGVLFSSGQCQSIHNNIIIPLMTGKKSLSSRDIEKLIESQLTGIVEGLLNGAQAGVGAFNAFLDTVSVCPAVNFSPHVWKGKYDKVFELIKAIKKLNDKGPEILAKFAQNVKSYNCKTYSVVFTVDIGALAILGAQRGIYVTWHMDQGVKEVGVVNGVSASYNLDPDFDISIGATVALLMGNKGVWGEWGYTLEFGASVPIYGVGVGFSGGIVFTADAKTKALGNFVGFTMGIDFSLGESSGTVDYDASITCGYVAAESFKDRMKKNNNAACLSKKGQAVRGLLNSFKGTSNAFDRKLDEVKRCGNLYACQAKQCAYGFSGKNFKSCQSAAGRCSTGMKECSKWEYSCKRTRYVEKNGSCKQRSCRDETKNVCEKVFGWFGFLKNVCKTVTKTICDGACIAWNTVVVPVTDTVITGTSCAAQGMVEVAEKTKCLQHLPNCAASGGCYIGQGAISAASCAGGMVIPSEKCLKDNKFV